MTRIYRINTSLVDGFGADNNDIGRVPQRGELGLYSDNNNKLTLVVGDGTRTHQESKILSPGVFYGSNADSGDGSGLDTIKLIPDASLGSDQYIVIDPTAPNHIHIRAGGTIDSSNAILYLGGENNNVTVQDSGYVTISATERTALSYKNGNGQVIVQDGEVFIQAGNASGTQTASWSFSSQGRIMFPGGEFFKVGNVPASSKGSAGDLAGTVAFSTSSVYYCVQDFGGLTATLIGGYSGGVYPSIIKTSEVKPLTGWSFVFDNVTYTLVADATEPNQGQWQLQIDQTIATTTTTITLTPNNNIWKRVSWSSDIW